MTCFLRNICGLAFLLLVMPVFVDANTITYNLNGGVNAPDNPTNYGNGLYTKVELKPATREGYAFLGWYFESSSLYNVSQNQVFDNSLSEYNLSRYYGDITVSARWGLVPKTPQKDDRGCYLITTAEELYGFREAYYADAKYTCVSLQNDIVVNKNLLDADGNLSTDDYVWWPSLGFYGTFDGNGFTISGLRGEGGLFGSLYSWDFEKIKSIVRNLGIKDSYFSADVAGGLVGTIDGIAWVYNVYSEASVHGSHAGGLVGREYPFEACPLSPPALSASRVGTRGIDYANVSVIENSYGLGHVEGGIVGGIVAAMNAAVLRNVFFAGTLQGEKTDCIIAEKFSNCSTKPVVVIENALCMDSKDTSVSKASTFSRDQFADGTVLGVLSNGNDDSCWTQKIGTDTHPVLKGVKAGIHYVLNGGENDESNPRYFSWGDNPFTLKDPVKANDAFEGWYSDGAFTNKVDSIDTRNMDELTLYAKWKSYFVITLEMGKEISSFRNSSGDLSCFGSCKIGWSADSSSFDLGTAYSNGWSFDAWYSDSLLTQKVTEIPAKNTDDITLYAAWTPFVYKVTYHMNGGVNHPDNPMTWTVLDGTVKLKDPSREGAVFSYWAAGGDKFYDYMFFPHDYDFYAQWIPIPKEPLKDSAGCFVISSKEELYWFADFASSCREGDCGRKSCASLQNDIVVNENLLKNSKLDLDTNNYFVWIPIRYFEGTFTGNGHSISGLYFKGKGISDGDRDDVKLFGGLFVDATQSSNVTDVEINDSYSDDFGTIEHLVISKEADNKSKEAGNNNNRIALPNVAAKSAWRIAVHGKSVTMSGLEPNRPLLMMDVQGRILRKQKTESSMKLDFAHPGRYLIRYGNVTRSISIR